MNDNSEHSVSLIFPVPANQDGRFLQVLHDKELDDLQALIAQLLIQLESLQQKPHTTKAAEHKQTKHGQTNFLSMLAHELRNPLQPLSYAISLLGKQAGDHAELHRLQAIMDRQINQMVRLVDDVLDASFISGGKITLEKSTLLLADIVALALETSQPKIDSRQQQLRVVLPQVPVYIYGDSVRLAQAFSNLLDNASKFSPENERIALTIQVVGKMVQIVVGDNGMGIVAELQPFVFDLFTQGLQSLDLAQGGLGVGLALVRSLVEMHGGIVRVGSEGIGLGSTFTVLLPLAPAPPATDHPRL